MTRVGVPEPPLDRDLPGGAGASTRSSPRLPSNVTNTAASAASQRAAAGPSRATTTRALRRTTPSPSRPRASGSRGCRRRPAGSPSASPSAPTTGRSRSSSSSSGRPRTRGRRAGSRRLDDRVQVGEVHRLLAAARRMPEVRVRPADERESPRRTIAPAGRQRRRHEHERRAERRGVQAGQPPDRPGDEQDPSGARPTAASGSALVQSQGREGHEAEEDQGEDQTSTETGSRRRPDERGPTRCRRPAGDARLRRAGAGAWPPRPVRRGVPRSPPAAATWTATSSRARRWPRWSRCPYPAARRASARSRRRS